jgi:hypothetical protein
MLGGKPRKRRRQKAKQPAAVRLLTARLALIRNFHTNLLLLNFEALREGLPARPPVSCQRWQSARPVWAQPPEIVFLARPAAISCSGRTQCAYRLTFFLPG